MARLPHEEAAVAYDPGTDDSDDPGVAAPVERVRRANESRLLAIDGVVGVGTGNTPIGDDAIKVYLRDRDAARRLPESIDGVPVVTEITGDIDAY